MKKKLLALMAVIGIACFSASCNYQVVDLTYNYNYAYIQLQNGEVIEGKVDAWRDYDDGEQLQVQIDGIVYLTSSYNCTLIYNPALK